MHLDFPKIEFVQIRPWPISRAPSFFHFFEGEETQIETIPEREFPLFKGLSHCAMRTEDGSNVLDPLWTDFWIARFGTSGLCIISVYKWKDTHLRGYATDMPRMSSHAQCSRQLFEMCLSAGDTSLVIVILAHKLCCPLIRIKNPPAKWAP